MGPRGRGRARGSGAGNHAGPPRGCFHRSLDFLFRSVPQGGRYDGPGSESFCAAFGDFGRLFRLPWRADGRVPRSDQVRHSGSGDGAFWGGLRKTVGWGTKNEFVYSRSLPAVRTPGSRASAVGRMGAC